MRQLVEVVPNFSAGRDPAVLAPITAAIEAVEGVELLDVDPGRATNRTVVTLVGSPDAAVEAAFAAIAAAAERIDMRQHQGAHPRMGATDVCPFVPVAGVTMADCVTLARRLGERVGEELGIPVYLYDQAATRPAFASLAEVRTGEYEGLASRDYDDPAWRPDFGPAAFHPASGATAIGAREFLIAYNVNLNTRDARIARQIALEIREKGRWSRDAAGKIARDAEGNKLRVSGRFPHCRAVGWYIEEYGQAQVTINLTNHRVTPVHAVFDAVCEEATARGARVTGSELVGLVPREAILAAGRHYLTRAGQSPGLPEPEVVHAARVSLGLDDVAPFAPQQKIVEYRVGQPAPLAQGSVAALSEALATDSPAPGGGSTAALCGALSAALSAMVATLTVSRPATEDAVRDSLGELALAAEAARLRLLAAGDEDSAAYEAVIAARRLPRKTAEDRATREAAIATATREAIRVPLSVLELAPELIGWASRVATEGLASSLSDAGVAGLTAQVAARGAFANVCINLPDLDDATERADLRARADVALDQVEAAGAALWGRVRASLGEA